MIFIGALRCVEARDDRVDLFLADGDEGLNPATEHATPRGFALDLPFDRRLGRSLFAQELRKILGSFLEVGGHAIVGLLHLFRRDFDLLGSRFLNLQGFVDQVAQHLQAQAFALLIGQGAAIGGDHQRQTLFDIGLRDDRPVDDRRRRPDVRILVPEDGDVLRDVEAAGDVFVIVEHRLADQRSRQGNRPGRCRNPKATPPQHQSTHLVTSSI